MTIASLFKDPARTRMFLWALGITVGVWLVVWVLCRLLFRASKAPARGFLLLLVTITGATVLALEVLWTRVIGTEYGSSLFVWAALITVTLVCLAFGYAVGGRLADRVPKPWMLYLLVMLAGGSVLLVPLMTDVLGPMTDLFGLIWGALASAMVLFFLPLTLLATAGP